MAIYLSLLNRKLGRDIEKIRLKNSYASMHSVIPGYCVFYNSKNVVMRPDSPPLLVGGIRHIQLSIFPVIGMECKA